ncbi:MAG: hypothetical protein CSA15_11655 [Candidatus Delongbacteria bacterium]|nr:MAG: hypothetical protein CSA15_11655 [Candidatus Delongbacteria bacterium]
MLKSINKLLTILMLLSTLSCSNNENKEIKSKNTKKILNISLKKEYVINDSDLEDDKKVFRPKELTVDNNGNLYVLDYFDMKIKKFDSKGSFLKEFGGKGSGPGQLLYPISPIYFENKIFLSERATNKLVSFDTDGNFLKDIAFEENLPDILSVAGDKVIGVSLVFDEKTSGKVFFSSIVNIYNSKFEKKVELYKETTPFIMEKIVNPFNSFPAFVGDSEKVFLAPKNVDKYEILEYSLENGNLLKKITRSFRKVPYTQDEIEYLLSNTKKILGLEGEKVKMKNRFKNSIKNIFIDKYKNIWVVPEYEGKMDRLKADIFSQEGKLKGKIDIEIPLSSYSRLETSVKFKNDKIYIIDKKEAKIYIYSYSYNE